MTPGIIAESDLSGNLKSEYVFFDGDRVARKDFSGNTTSVSYYFSDHLKTASVITNSSGTITEDEDYYPWGGEIPFVNSDPNHYKFTGKERDSETGLDYFGARYYSNPLGRFLTPDWAAKATAVPYANFGNPQSLNLYSYVQNNSTTLGDPDGHFVQGDQNDQKKQPPQIPQYVFKPAPKSAFEQKIVNLLNGKGWKTNSQAAAQDAQDRAAWDKAHPLTPYPELKIGIVSPVGGMGGPALADDALVVRGGLNQAENFAKGSGVTTDAAGNLQGVSVNSANGKTVEQLSQGIKNGQVGVSTVGEVRAAGGEVTPSPTANNPNHCTMCGVTPQKAQELFTPTIPNPSKPQQ